MATTSRKTERCDEGTSNANFSTTICLNSLTDVGFSSILSDGKEIVEKIELTGKEIQTVTVQASLVASYSLRVNIGKRGVENTSTS